MSSVVKVGDTVRFTKGFLQSVAMLSGPVAPTSLGPFAPVIVTSIAPISHRSALV